MKKVVLFLFLLSSALLLSAQEQRGVSIGIHILGGGRYDNVRMCVGSPPGVPGGPIGEFYLDIRIPVGTDGTVVVNIPLFRPILFAAQFGMAQIEPLVMYEHMLGEGTGTRPVIGAGLGAVFHYGPDYNSSPGNPGAAFFSIGPLFNAFAGLYIGESNVMAGIKGFASPLFSADRPAGLVAGAGVELHYSFGNR
jgi:hypothetical protein